MATNNRLAQTKTFPPPRLFNGRTEADIERYWYCDEAHGAILNALLDRGDQPEDLDAVLRQDFNRFQALVRKLNLGPGGRGHKETNKSTIRNCVDWVRTQAIDHGALIDTDKGLVRGRSFKSDAEATKWLDGTITRPARPRMPKRPRGLRYRHTSPNQSLPALETLSLADSEPDEVVTRNNGRRVSFSQPSPSRSRSSSRTRRFVRRRTNEMRHEGRALRF